jgi:hypothetical protein
VSLARGGSIPLDRTNNAQRIDFIYVSCSRHLMPRCFADRQRVKVAKAQACTSAPLTSQFALDPKTGFEVSAAPGFTFNWENPDTDYRTGTEFHVEFAVLEHFSQKFAVGVAGFHYQQITADSGAGARLGPRDVHRTRDDLQFQSWKDSG